MSPGSEQSKKKGTILAKKTASFDPNVNLEKGALIINTCPLGERGRLKLPRPSEPMGRGQGAVDKGDRSIRSTNGSKWSLTGGEKLA